MNLRHLQDRGHGLAHPHELAPLLEKGEERPQISEISDASGHGPATLPLRKAIRNDLRQGHRARVNIVNEQFIPCVRLPQK